MKNRSQTVMVRLVWDMATDDSYMQFFLNNGLVEIECELDTIWKQEIKAIFDNLNDFVYIRGDVYYLSNSCIWKQHCFTSLSSSAMNIDLEDMDIMMKDSKIIVYGKIDKCLLN